MEKVNDNIKSILLLVLIHQTSGMLCRVTISKTERSMVSVRLFLTELLTIVRGMFL